MLGIDVGDDRDVGRQLEESAVGFVGLHHHPVAAAEPRIGAVGVDDAAVDHGRIEAAGVEQGRRPSRWSWSCRGCRRSRRSFSAASARPASRRAAPPAGAAARAATSSGLSRLIADETTTTSAWSMILGLVADVTVAPLLAQPLDIGVVGGVGALHRVAEIDQHLGDAAHADAADADEMDRPDVARKFHQFDAPRLSSPANAGDPVNAGVRLWHGIRKWKPMITGCPAFAGHDTSGVNGPPSSRPVPPPVGAVERCRGIGGGRHHSEPRSGLARRSNGLPAATSSHEDNRIGCRR